MSLETVPQTVTVNAVKGNVYALDSEGKVRAIKIGDTLVSGEVIITENEASLEVIAEGSLYLVNENCVACIPEPVQTNGVVQAFIDGEISFSPTRIANAAFAAEDVAAIQNSILEGVDPTIVFEAPTAGSEGGADGGSVNAGFVVIERDGVEAIASTSFETLASSIDEASEEDLERRNITIFADGGQSLSSQVTEGSISLSSYPQTISSSGLVEAGDLALNTASFVPETSSLESLLAELNSDITSGGQPVAFVYDESQNAIIGTQEGNEVLRIEIEATSLGRDLELEVVTTISQGIDHVASVADGQVSISGDQINIAFDITGADIGGNSIQAPIDFTTTVIDGDDPAPQNVTFE
ncbi:retention module-containing protein, partial [Vibrio jasicida]